MSSGVIQCVVLGATGYAGSELLALLHKNPHFSVVKAFGSAEREAIRWRELAPQLAAHSSLMIEPWDMAQLDHVSVQAAFLALPHAASADIAPALLARGIQVFDLSGAFRFHNACDFAQAYGFEHPAPTLLAQAQYMLMPWYSAQAEHSVYAIPGCYPTASLLALKPLVDAGFIQGTPVITAISGVSGAGRGANPATSFCEVSMKAYGVLQHRHQPEISQQLGCDVVFTPVLGPYARGILAVCTVTLTEQGAVTNLQAHFQAQYAEHVLVQVVPAPPAVNHVAHTPFAHLHVAQKESTAVITVAIDNLVMGAAGQAMQAANQVFGLNAYAGLLP
ncbi:N-acetyl-gamma-glutamyl-phosphate reductase [Aliidiomarina taiwanensis]|uniref:N-acetyl-gamma-glutamyl-phosphate reductase n=1 Tax=Aliidiomarina taiwanensis TaxID=946228 RepID=A0A432X9S6_9GAMM|nr:N-acetyl-gamma-glutamyl-phosphate reductase [Aliidiomarina taiwanensis]RUO43991.1 N-acetyl-gamma-glutamyl-phosphate reductase [Aliidiomarina taiwanensis]